MVPRNMYVRISCQLLILTCTATAVAYTLPSTPVHTLSVVARRPGIAHGIELQSYVIALLYENVTSGFWEPTAEAVQQTHGVEPPFVFRTIIAAPTIFPGKNTRN